MDDPILELILKLLKIALMYFAPIMLVIWLMVRPGIIGDILNIIWFLIRKAALVVGIIVAIWLVLHVIGIA